MELDHIHETRSEPVDLEWRQAVLELSRAQRAYEEVTATPDAPDVVVNRIWLWLWRAERRRDELLRRGVHSELLQEHASGGLDALTGDPPVVVG